MFRLEIFVEDKHLARLLHALNGLVTQMSGPQPVVNAEYKNGKLVAKSSGSLPDAVYADLCEKFDGGAVSTSAIKKSGQAHGGGPNCHQYLIKNLVKAKRLAKTKKRGVYSLIKGK